ncbi:MAG TPA: hypothetical protein VEC12_06470 [Bacteroidia bacterium]|nr:hypothetical protein [Bacteroidia bacterium]
MFNKLFLACISAVILAGCAATRYTVNPPAQAELAAAQKRWPSITLNELQNGHTIYTTKCNKCHGLKNIMKLTESHWDHEIDEMAPKAKLTAEEKETLKKYIFTVRGMGETKQAAN